MRIARERGFEKPRVVVDDEGAMIVIVMLNAIGSVHWRNGFWNAAGG